MPRTWRQRLARPPIRRMVKRIVDKFHPEQVILFGSRARGDHRSDSDVDLLVVMDFEGNAREKALDMQLAIHDLQIPTDIIVTRPEDFAWRKEVVGTIEWPAAREGKYFMPVPDPALAVVRRWVAKAENDLKNAAHTLTLERDCPTDTVCFHAQQCVEKYIKALLTLRAIPFHNTHDVHALRILLPAKMRPKLDKKTEKRLTDYATVLRYPDLGPDITLTEARRAVAVARRVRREIRKHLPPAALRRKRK